MNELALFTGAGGGLLGSSICGITCVGGVELDESARDMLFARQRDGWLPEFPIWDDIKTFRLDNPECQEFINFLKSIRRDLIITGGFPCQDVSISGPGSGLAGARSGLWFEMWRVIRQIRPAFALVENSPALTIRGMRELLGNVAEIGYHARWRVLEGGGLGDCVTGARIWILAYEADSVGLVETEIQAKIFDPQKSSRRQFERASSSFIQEEAYSDIHGNPDELADWMDRFKAIGNGQNPKMVGTILNTIG